MQSIYNKAFNFIDNAQPSYLGIYFSMFFHFSILLMAIGLPDFFKQKTIPLPQVIPIEILNVSDVTSLKNDREDLEINKIEKKLIKQKKFNSSENTEIAKIDLQEKPKKNIIQSQEVLDSSFSSSKLETKKINIKEKKINNLKEEKIIKLENVETLKVSKIKPKLKPKPKPTTTEKIETKSDVEIEDKIKPKIKNEKKKAIDQPKPVKKPEQDFNIASVLKDLRNEEVSNVLEEDVEDDDKLENNQEDMKQNENKEVSISEMDLVLQQLRSCFNPRAGTQIVGNEMVKIRAKIDRAANVRKDTVQIIDTNISKSNPYYEAITESAVATLYNPLCSQLKLPLDKYESWKELKIIIDYSWIKN